MKRTFSVSAFWDQENEVWCSESDITGLHIEAPTLQEFEEVLKDSAIELILANHISLQDIAKKSISELVPTILWQKPVAESI